MLIETEKRFSAWIEEFREYLENGRYAKSMIDNYYYSSKIFTGFLKETQVNEIGAVTSDTLHEYKAWVMKKRGVKPETANYLRKRAHRFLVFLKTKKGLDINALTDRKKHKNESELNSFPEEFRRYYEEYIERKKRENSPKNSMKKMEFHIRLFYRYLWNERQISRLIEVKREDVREFIKYLSDLTDSKGSDVSQGPNHKRYQIDSINRCISDLRPYFNWLSKRGIFMGLSAHLKLVRKEHHLSRNILTRKEIVKLLNVKTESPYEFMMKAIMVLLYASGLRIGELLGLKLSDIDLERKEAFVLEPKTRKERIVQLGEVGSSYLKLYIENARCQIGHGNNEEKVFLSIYDGKGLREEAVNKWLKRFCARTDIKKRITCHCFRHSYGTHLLENGAGIKQVSELLGHANLESTERYTHLNPEHLRKTLLKYHPRECAVSNPVDSINSLQEEEGK